MLSLLTGGLVLVLLFWSTGRTLAEPAGCSGHGVVVGCDSNTGRVVCSDGALDMQIPCTKGRKRRPKARELKFKPATTHGQILVPGQKPPSSTLEQSARDLGTTK